MRAAKLAPAALPAGHWLLSSLPSRPRQVPRCVHELVYPPSARILRPGRRSACATLLDGTPYVLTDVGGTNGGGGVGPAPTESARRRCRARGRRARSPRDSCSKGAPAQRGLCTSTDGRSSRARYDATASIVVTAESPPIQPIPIIPADFRTPFARAAPLRLAPGSELGGREREIPPTSLQSSSAAKRGPRKRRKSYATERRAGRVYPPRCSTPVEIGAVSLRGRIP